MPIEINEMVVKIVVDEGARESRPGVSRPQEDDDEIVRRCVEAVLEILRQKKER